MNIGDLITELMASPSGMALQAVVALGVLELVTGIGRAVAGKTFQLGLIDTWVRSQLAGRIVPIALTLIVGVAVPDMTALGLDLNIVTLAGLGAAGVYGVAALKSIVGNLNPSEPDPLPTAE